MRRIALWGALFLCLGSAMADEREDALKKANESVAAAMPKAQADPTRPVVHVMPRAFWTNDPNAPMLLNGEYHLFSQHNPYGNDWGHMHFAHYRSTDLVRWTREDIALWPSISQGEEHCFSGSAIVAPDGLPRIFYTSIGPKTGAGDAAVQWMATGDATGMTWEKSPKNPVMTLALHGDMKVREWRDPYVWKQGNEYRCVLGGALEGDKGAAMIYGSPDLENWTYLGVLCEEPEAGRKGSWECPNFFRLGEKWVLIVSRDGVRYFTGTFDEANHRFSIEKSGNVDLDRRFYAPNGLFDATGRHVLWGWVTGISGDHWNGCLTLPRVLTLSREGALQSTPLPELRALRGREYKAGKPLAPTCEISVSIPPAKAGVSGITVTNGAKENGERAFGVDWAAKELVLGDKRAPLGNAEGRVLLRIFIDRSVVEVFLDDGRSLTATWPGNGAASLNILPISETGAADVIVKAWELNTIWK